MGSRSHDFTMLISPEQEAQIGQVFDTYLKEHHQGDILQLIADADEETHHAVVVNAMTLFEANMELGDYFNAYPNDVLAIFDKVLLKTTMELSDNTKHHSGQRTKQPRMRHTPHTRITGLPVCPELTRDTIPRSRDVGHFLSVTGTVIRTSVTKVLEYERDYMCAKCRHVFTVEADFDQFYTFIQVLACPNPDGCNSYKFTCLSEGSEPAACKDYQEIKIQEQVQRLTVGSIPRSMVVVLEDDLVDSCKSGDDVTVYGVMCQRWKPFYDNSRCDVELVLKANNIEVNNQQAAAALVMMDVQKEFEDFWNNYKRDPIAGRNQILLSLCPQVFGMYLIKLAVAMVLAGGVQRIDSSGTKIRGECHMLLVGDPGTGKSQFLKYAAKIMPRSVLTAGIGSTSAGLTVAAVKDGGDWHLEAGALVLSDGGLCCIDEFNSIKEHDRISIHEAMEQQSISVAKAGMVCKLNTRTTILAATNPKGQYNPNEPLSVNVALASPLLSRFDLVLILMDTRNTEWDRIISSFILEERGLCAESSSLWSMEKMKAYFSLIKRLQPQVSDEANKILSRYYQLQRQSDSRNTARTTIRMLESLSRLAEAHARLMYRETVTIEDAIMAVSVMECSMQGGALLGNVNALLTSFPADPGQQYQTQCQVLLEGLDLPLLLQKEMGRLARLKSNTSEANAPTAKHHHQLRDTLSINNTHGHDITKNCERDCLDWFHSITPSMTPDDMASPIITSTQNSNRKPDPTWSEMSAVTEQSKCQTEKDIGNAGSALNCSLVSNSLGSFASASEEERQDGERNEKNTEKSSKTQGEMKQVEEERDKRRSEQSVLEKVSKNLRDRRLRELKLSHQGRGKEDRGGLGHENVTSGSKTSRTLSSDKTSPTNTHTQINLSPSREGGLVKVDKKDQTGTKNSCLAQMENTAAEAETSEELFSKLSSFIYKPKKMKPSVHNHDRNVCSDVSAEFQTERKSNTESQMGKQRLVSDDDSVGRLTGTEKKKGQKQVLSEVRGRRKQLSCVSEVGRSESRTCFPSKELRKGASSFRQEEDMTGGRLKGGQDAANLCRQQRTRVSSGDETRGDSFTYSPPLKPGTLIRDPAAVKSGHSSSTVTSSTLAKLSTFSFTCKSDLTTTAETRVEKNPPVGTETPRKTETVVTMDSLKDNPPPTDTELTPGQKRAEGTGSSTKMMSKCKEKQSEPDHCTNHSHSVKPVTGGAPDFENHENTVNLRKRKCFELGPPRSSVGGSKGLFSELSLFGSGGFSNDVLDTDWDQEVSKKAKN